MAATVPTWADLVFIGKWDIPWIYLAGWWFQTWFGFFHFIYGMSSFLPIDEFMHIFQRGRYTMVYHQPAGIYHDIDSKHDAVV